MQNIPCLSALQNYGFMEMQMTANVMLTFLLCKKAMALIWRWMKRLWVFKGYKAYVQRNLKITISIT